MKMTSGLLSMTIKYAYQRGNSIYFQRAIPDDLQARYDAKRIKIKLDARDMKTAAGQIEALNRSLEGEWKMLRGDTSAPPKSLRSRAADLLTRYGLEPGAPTQDPFALEAFYGHLDGKREAFAKGDEETYRQADAGDYLTPHEVVAAQMAAGTLKASLSDALELYLELHKKKDDKDFEEFTRHAVGRLIGIIGDPSLDTLKRSHAHKAVTAFQAEGLASGTIRRWFNTYTAVISFYLKEKDIDRRNPFASMPIPGEGKDAQKRVTFTHTELQALGQLCKTKDDSIRWLVAMLADTGARLAEVVGLSLEDIQLDDATPHIVIQPHPWRTLKSLESHRKVPLVGMAKWAANRIVDRARKGQIFAFPQYIAEGVTNADSASATIAKWLRAQSLDHTAHELRHTITDRLREVQCPKDVRLAIGGWASEGVGDTYGTGYGLRVKAEWLERIVIRDEDNKKAPAD